MNIIINEHHNKLILLVQSCDQINYLYVVILILFDKISEFLFASVEQQDLKCIEFNFFYFIESNSPLLFYLFVPLRRICHHPPHYDSFFYGLNCVLMGGKGENLPFPTQDFMKYISTL